VRQRKYWGRCISHGGSDIAAFVSDHFGEPHRKVLLVAGAGFDPRAQAVARVLTSAVKRPLSGVFIREERAGAEPVLKQKADHNTAELLALAPDAKVLSVDIFATDGAVVGGRRIVDSLNAVTIAQDCTDIVVDFSALSLGIAYPATKFFIDAVQALAGQGPQFPNLHVMVADSPSVDASITSVSSDKIEAIHGFKGEFSLEARARAAKLWLPQLRKDKRLVLGRIHRFVDPADVCPVLPFPSRDPRVGDRLIDHFREEFESSWAIDAHDIVFADERDPLDLYRAILDIHDARERVFRDIGGSLTVLTPMGSKVLSVGALMAAVERGFPVIYCEALSYSLSGAPQPPDTSELIHVWLLGEAYAGLNRGEL
jgi:hypothetical protein